MNICSYCRDPECRVPDARARLGYTTCIDCGEQVASKLTEQRKSRLHLLITKVHTNI